VGSDSDGSRSPQASSDAFRVRYSYIVAMSRQRAAFSRTSATGFNTAAASPCASSHQRSCKSLQPVGRTMVRSALTQITWSSESAVSRRMRAVVSLTARISRRALPVLVNSSAPCAIERWNPSMRPLESGEAHYLHPPRPQLSMQHQTRRATEGPRATGRPRVQHPGPFPLVAEQAVSMAIDDCSGLGIVTT